MKASIGNLVAWFKSRNVTSHTVAGLISLVAGVYITDVDVRTFVFDMLRNHPKILAIIGSGCALWLKYSVAHSASGIMQEVPAAEAKLVSKQEVGP